MEKSTFDEKIGSLRKAVESSRGAWKKTLQATEAKWRGELAQRERQIAALRRELASQNSQWESKYNEKERERAASSDSCAGLRSDVANLREKLAVNAERLSAAESELQLAQKEHVEELDKRDATARELSSKLAGFEEESSVLKSRLSDEQRRWDEVLQMKEKDFTVLQRELEKKAKEWEKEYQKDEAEIVVVREGRLKLERQLEEFSDRLKEQQAKASENLEIKQNSIAALRKENQIQDRQWKERLDEKEAEVDAIRRQLESALREMSGIGEVAAEEAFAGDQAAESGSERPSDPEPAEGGPEGKGGIDGDKKRGDS